MTKVKAHPKESFAELASQMARNPETLTAFTEAMMDAQRKREIGGRIAEERDRRGLKQPQVVERLGMKPGALRKYQYWEEGKHLPGNEVLEEIAEIVGCSFDYLMTGGRQAPPAKDILTRLDRIEEALRALGATAPASDDELRDMGAESEGEISDDAEDEDEPGQAEGSGS